jgi:predicted dehydrogenase
MHFFLTESHRLQTSKSHLISYPRVNPEVCVKQFSPRKKIRYAVIGLGHIAQVAVLPAFQNARNSQLLALVSSDQRKLKRLGKKYRLEHVYSYRDYGRVLSNVDAVYLALPNHLHREYAERAAAAGVHVLCEKPMAPTSQDCMAMIRAAQQNNVKLMIAYRLHFEAGNLQAIQLGRSGKLGDLRLFSSEFSQQVTESNVRVTESIGHGGGPVYDMGVYCINAARYLFGANPIELTALSVRKNEKRFERVDEAVSVIARFPGERVASFTCSFGAADVSQYTLVGSKGVLRSNPAYEYAEAIQHEVVIGEKTTRKKFPKRDQFAAELIYFSDCILQNKEPEPSGYEGLADVQIVEAIYESIRTRRTVRVAPVHVKQRPDIRQEIRRPPHGEPTVIRAQAPSREAA